MNKPLLTVLLAMGAAMAASMPRDSAAADSDPDAVYDAFNTFCLKSFGAEKEPLTYERFGDVLAVTEGSRWMHVSERSACIAWGTNLPARTVVEYGPTPKLGMTTQEPERPFYTHVHYLKNLEPNKTYHYRLTGTDERGQTVQGPVETFKTSSPSGKVTHIEQLPGGEAVVITAPGYYLVTADLVAKATAFRIETNNVTLDLGGHTVTYDQVTMGPIEGDSWAWMDKGPHGAFIAARRLKDIRIVNGTFKQGAGGDGGQDNGVGANPIASHSGVTGEIAGVTVEWYGVQTRGLLLQSAAPIDLHHNVITDKGTELTNRHQGVPAISSSRNPHHNLIKRTRHRGFDAVDGGDIYANEIYIDSCATNSFGVFAYKTKNLKVRGNRIFGGGYLAVGIGTVSQGVSDVQVFDNFVHMQSSKPSAEWAEYGEQSGAYCYRVTWGGVNLDVYDNYFITYGRDGGMVRAIWYCPDKAQHNNRIHDNVVKAIAQNDASDLHGTIVISGVTESGIEPVRIENNRVISNFLHVRLGEKYGSGSHTRFANNTFERVGNLPRFRWVQIGFWTPDCIDNQFIDPKFVGKVNLEQVKWEGEAESQRAFDVGFTLTVKATPGAKVTVTNAKGQLAAEGTAEGGVFEAQLLAVHFENGSHTLLTPHTVAITENGRTSERKVTLDEPIELQW